MRTLAAAMLLATLCIAAGCNTADPTPLNASQLLVLTATETGGEDAVRVSVSLDGNTLLDGQIGAGSMRRIVLHDPLAPGESLIDTGEHRINYRLYRTWTATGHGELTLTADQRLVLSVNTGGIAPGFWRSGKFNVAMGVASSPPSATARAERLAASSPESAAAEPREPGDADVLWRSMPASERGTTTRPDDRPKIAPGVRASQADASEPGEGDMSGPQAPDPQITPLPAAPAPVEVEEKPDERKPRKNPAPEIKLVFE